MSKATKFIKIFFLKLKTDKFNSLAENRSEDSFTGNVTQEIMNESNTENEKPLIYPTLKLHNTNEKSVSLESNNFVIQIEIQNSNNSCSWYKYDNNQTSKIQLETTERIDASENKLIIKDLVKFDSGKYFCEVENENGTSIILVELNVMSNFK